LQRLYRRKPKLQKRNKHESWVKRGGLGAFVAENSTASFFAPKVAKTVLQGEFCNVCTVENRNYQNATNMSLGSNGVDWVRSLRKIQLRVFLLQKSLKRPPGRVLQRLYRRKPKLQKRNKHESLVKRGGLGAFVAENSTASFFVPKVAKTALQGEFATFVPSKTETTKTQQT
jgi:hypothetical protein